MYKALGQRRFFSETIWGEKVGVSQFVGIFAEVAHLDPASFNQGFEAEVDAADVDANFFSQTALGHARVILEQLECPKKGVVVGGLAACGHRVNSV